MHFNVTGAYIRMINKQKQMIINQHQCHQGHRMFSMIAYFMTELTGTLCIKLVLCCSKLIT